MWGMIISGIQVMSLHLIQALLHLFDGMQGIRVGT